MRRQRRWHRRGRPRPAGEALPLARLTPAFTPGAAGSYAGTRLSSSVPPDLLLSLFAGLLLAAAAAMLRRRPGTARRRERAGGSTILRRILKITAAATRVGQRVASRVDPSRLTTGFTVLLIAVAGYSLARSLPGLV